MNGNVSMSLCGPRTGEKTAFTKRDRRLPSFMPFLQCSVRQRHPYAQTHWAQRPNREEIEL